MIPRLSWLIFALSVAAAGAAPLVSHSNSQTPAPSAAWPALFEGRALTPLPAAPEDALLARGFPGRVARFTDGRRQIVLRQVTAPTRRLHPASDCFRASGYGIRPAPMQVAQGRGPASCFLATRAGRTFRVCERIAGPRGESWPDVSSWYWSALLDPASGPWLAALTVQPLAAAAD
jgi:hypothetical protein